MFLPPTALKLMRQADVQHAGVKLRSILTGGESLGGELLDWVRATFGIDAHEIYGQTECNLVVGNDVKTVSDPAGLDGQADAGLRRPHRRRAGQGAAARRARHHRRAPAQSLHHARTTGTTRRRPRKKFAGDFLLTGDLGRQDDDGYFWYDSREDDVITSAGYRIGPSEIEHTLLKHPAVAFAAVVGVPDPIRTEAIKAWIVLRPGFAASDALARNDPGFRQGATRRPRISAPDRLRRHPADDRHRQGAAPRFAGEGVVTASSPSSMRARARRSGCMRRASAACEARNAILRAAAQQRDSGFAFAAARAPE